MSCKRWMLSRYKKVQQRTSNLFVGVLLLVFLAAPAASISLNRLPSSSTSEVLPSGEESAAGILRTGVGSVSITNAVHFDDCCVCFLKMCCMGILNDIECCSSSQFFS